MKTHSAPNILINVPRLNMPGGVANFYKTLRPHLNPQHRYFEIGARADDTGTLAMLKRIVKDFYAFHRALATGDYSLVHLNPSLEPKATLRDAVFILIARAHSVPLLVFFHGWEESFQSLIVRRFKLLFRYVFGKASIVIVLAEDFRKQLEEIRIEVPVITMTTCIDDALLEISRPEPGQSPTTEILYLSRLDRAKGATESIKAFAVLKRAYPQITLSIAGDGPERNIAERLVEAEELSGVRFLGYIDGDVKKRAFLDAEIFLFPTFYGEGMPINILEAMALGLPVVTRSVGGLKDFFENGRMGFITTSNEIEDISGLLKQLIDNPDLRHRMGRYNRQYARDHFSASMVAEKLEELYARYSG